MTRRMVNSELFKNVELGECEPLTRLLYIGMIVNADDEGRMRAHPKYLRSAIFPFDHMNDRQIIEMRNSLAKKNLIVIYESDGSEYVNHPKWEKWQILRKDRMKQSSCPSPRAQTSTICQPNDNHGAAEVKVVEVKEVKESEYKTPSAKAALPFWQEMIKHLNDSWSRKKRGAKYVWSGKDFAALKRVSAVYQAFDIMALWDIYIASDDEFARRQGYNVPEFVRQLPRLVDGIWKPTAQSYMEKLMPSNTEGVAQVKELVGSLGKVIP
jgi:hypothetical protein